MKAFFYYFFKIILVIVKVFTVLLEIISLVYLFSNDSKIITFILMLIFWYLGISLPNRILKKMKKPQSTVSEIYEYESIKPKSSSSDTTMEDAPQKKDYAWKTKYNAIKSGKKIYINTIKDMLSYNSIDLKYFAVLNEIMNEYKLSKWFINKNNRKYLLPFIKYCARELIFSNKFTEKQKEIFSQLSCFILIEKSFIDTLIKNQAVEYFYYMKNQAIADERLTPNEERELSNIAKKLDLSEEDIMMSSSDKTQLALYRLYNEIDNGYLPNIESSVLLTRGEICHYESDADRVITNTRVIGYGGGTAGISLRIAKGVTIRTSAFRGHPITREYETEHEGTLTVTNKRLIFISRSKGFVAPIQNIVGLEGFSDGLGIQHGQKYYLMRCKNPQLLAMIIAASISKK